MTVTKKFGTALVLSILFIIIMLGLQGKTAFADTSTFPNYVFKINSSSYSDGGQYELKKSSIQVSVSATTADWTMAPYKVEWNSDETGVVSVRPMGNPTTGVGTDTAYFDRKGPGYTTIKARIYKDATTYKDIYLMVLVDMEIDQTLTGTIEGTMAGTKYLILYKDDLHPGSDTKQIKLKYMDYVEDTGSVSGSAIDVPVHFTSSNPAVATVDETSGIVTAKSAGEAEITITSTTLNSKDIPLTKKLQVFVTPYFNLTYTPATGSAITCSSRDSNSALPVYHGVPSKFDIKPNASDATYLNWEVTRILGSTRTKLDLSKTNLMTFAVDSDGTVHCSGVKAGTYEIRAYIHGYTDSSVRVPYAKMKIYVPVDFGDRNIVMNVNDIYDILDNSNLPGIIYSVSSGYDTDIAKLDTSNFVITANKKGSVSIHLTYIESQEILDGDNTIPKDVTINVTVIDGVGISTTRATLYEGGTLPLYPIQTNHNKPVWTSSNTGVAKVDKDTGLVTAVKRGYATITLSVKSDDGVLKKATCEITVQPSVSSIKLDHDNVTLAIGGSLTLRATPTPSDLSGITLQWRSSNEGVVTINQPTGALDATITGKAGGRAVICAINQDNVIVGYCHVTVQQPVLTISLSQTTAVLDMSVKKLQLTATVTPDNATNQAVKWASADASKATVNATTGMVTFVKPGTVTIVATSVDNPAAVAYCNLTIQTPVASLSLDETTKTMYIGQTARLSYVVLPASASNNVVSWVSSDSRVATVDSTGLVTAKGVGTTVIMVKSLDGGLTAYCTVTVKQVATGIKFDVSTLNLKSGEYYTIKTTLSPTGSTDVGILWQTSDSKVATVDTNGKILAKNAGTCVIMAKTESGAVAYCKVTVTQGVNGLILNFSEKTIYKGQKFDLTVSVSPSTATKLDVTWTSSNTKIAKVSDRGEVEGIIGGTAVITCKTVDGGYAATCVVTVKETVTSIKLNHSSYRMGVKKKVILNATVKTETATNHNVKWKSSNKKVAVVSQKGKVTAIKKGYATITAIAKDGSEAEASCEIRVVTPVRSIRVSRATLTLYVGSSKKLHVKVKPSNATYKSAKWSSSDKSIATVTSDRTVIGEKVGNATITAKAKDSSSKKSICYVSVLERVPSTGVTLQDRAITMVPGESKTVNVVLLPANSTDGKKWSTDNAAVASINKKTGRITARATGTAYITVMTSSGKTATVEVTVIGLNIRKLAAEEYTNYPTALSVEGATTAVSWRSDNPMIAIVYSDGTISTRGAGTATITATVNGRRLSCKVVVRRMS